MVQLWPQPAEACLFIFADNVSLDRHIKSDVHTCSSAAGYADCYCQVARARARREAPAFECNGEFSWALRRASRHAPFHNQPDLCVRNLIEGTRAVFTVYLQELGFFKET